MHPNTVENKEKRCGTTNVKNKLTLRESNTQPGLGAQEPGSGSTSLTTK